MANLLIEKPAASEHAPHFTKYIDLVPAGDVLGATGPAPEWEKTARELIPCDVVFGCTDGPMTDAELEEARKAGGEVVHIPLILGAVVPA